MFSLIALSTGRVQNGRASSSYSNWSSLQLALGSRTGIMACKLIVAAGGAVFILVVGGVGGGDPYEGEKITYTYISQ